MRYFPWIIALIELFIILFMNKHESVKHITTTDTIIQKQNIIKDSIKVINKTIEKTNIKYEKDYNVILTQPVDSDCKLFVEYLSKNTK